MIVALEVAQYLEYSKIHNIDNNISIGYSLGEISSLIAANVLDIREGIEFVKERAKLSDEFYRNDLCKEKYYIGRVPYEDKIEKELLKKGFKIINFVPDFTKTNTSSIIIGKNKEDIFNFMKYKRKDEPLENLRMSELVCPFKDKIKVFNSKNLEKIFCTRTATMYSNDMSKEDINDSLAEYLVTPIQTRRTMEYFEKTGYKEKDIIVIMGKNFINDHLQEQCNIIGLNGNIIDADNLIIGGKR